MFAAKESRFRLWRISRNTRARTPSTPSITNLNEVNFGRKSCILEIWHNRIYSHMMINVTKLQFKLAWVISICISQSCDKYATNYLSTQQATSLVAPVSLARPRWASCLWCLKRWRCCLRACGNCRICTTDSKTRRRGSGSDIWISLLIPRFVQGPGLLSRF